MEPDYKTLDGLKSHPLFQLLSKKQQTFVVAFIESKGDRMFAAKQAYGGRGKRPDQIAMRAMRTAYIRQLLALFYGYNVDQSRMGKLELIGLVAARLRKADVNDAAFCKLVDHYIELTERPRKTGREDQATEEKNAVDAEPDIDALVQQIEQKRKQ